MRCYLDNANWLAFANDFKNINKPSLHLVLLSICFNTG